MILFCTNSLPSFIQHQGLRQYEAFLNILKPSIITNQCSGSIEKRSKYFSDSINRIANNKPLHIVAYSLAGLDIRYAIQNNPQLQQQTKTLITIGTPHRGSYIAQQYRLRKFDRDIVDPICRVMGINSRYFEEINPDNIRDFNLVTPNKENIKYYSIGGETILSNMSTIYQKTGQIIEKEFQYPQVSGSDGVFAHSEVQWGNHIINIDCDHGSLMGTPHKQNGEFIADIVSQQIQHQQ